MSIERIFLSSDDREYYFSETPQEYTDVVVKLESKEKYGATFFSFNEIKEINTRHKLQNEFLGGSYFWARNMILIDVCKRKEIEQVVNDLWDEGNFFFAFRKLDKNSCG